MPEMRTCQAPPLESRGRRLPASRCAAGRCCGVTHASVRPPHLHSRCYDPRAAAANRWSRLESWMMQAADLQINGQGVGGPDIKRSVTYDACTCWLPFPYRSCVIPPTWSSSANIEGICSHLVGLQAHGPAHRRRRLRCARCPQAQTRIAPRARTTTA
jgi:hypothetical protein